MFETLVINSLGSAHYSYLIPIKKCIANAEACSESEPDWNLNTPFRYLASVLIIKKKL